ncbi:AAA family ATPase [Desulfococcaceae bacterium HSG7]|nr:AAA family ATPase [Desulfococcaceae bacterium HSG7]
MSERAECIIFANQKGGTGKTSSCLAIAGHLVQKGYKVLAVDIDPQANLTLGLGFSKSMVEKTMYDAILNHCNGYEGVSIKEVVIETKLENFHLAPAESDLCVAEILVQDAQDRTGVIKQVLEDVISLYDYILIDPPPHLGLLMLNGLRASDQVVVPVDAGIFSLVSLENFQNYCDEMKEMTGHAIEKKTVVMTRYARPGFISKLMRKTCPPQEMKEMLGKMYEHVFFVPESTEIYDAHKECLPISHFAPNSKISNTYRRITEHIVSLDKIIQL